MVGRCISYWNSPLLGDMLVFWGVMHHWWGQRHATLEHLWTYIGRFHLSHKKNVPVKSCSNRNPAFTSFVRCVLLPFCCCCCWCCCWCCCCCCCCCCCLDHFLCLPTIFSKNWVSEMESVSLKPSSVRKEWAMASSPIKTMPGNLGPEKLEVKNPGKWTFFNLKSCKFGSDDVPFQLGDFLCSMFVFSGAGAFTTTCRMLKNPWKLPPCRVSCTFDGDSLQIHHDT